MTMQTINDKLSAYAETVNFIDELKKEMDTSNESIIRALIVLKKVCEGKKECVKCPLRRSDGAGCEINSKTPVSWEINVSDKTWRAFRE